MFELSKKKIAVVFLAVAVLGLMVYFTFLSIEIIRSVLYEKIIHANLQNFKLTLESWWYRLDFYGIGLESKFGLANLAAGDASILPLGKAQGIPVLLYHGIINKPDADGMPVNTFKDELFTLKRAGYETVSLEDLYQFVYGQKDLPQKSLVITFDDGRKDSYYNADPILKALDYKAAMFVITRFSIDDARSSSYYLDKYELARMVSSGRWELESHGRDDHLLYQTGKNGPMAHFFNKFWLSDQNRFETDDEFSKKIYGDLIASKNDLEKNLPAKVLGFAFPFGDLGQDSLNFPNLKQIITNTVRPIYPLAFYQAWAGGDFRYVYQGENNFLIRRIEPQSSWSGQDLLNLLSLWVPKDLPYNSDSPDIKEWVNNWGRASLRSGALMMSADPGAAGSTFFLEGTRHWKDYQFDAEINILSGKNFSLLARFKNSENFAACSFGSDFFHIVQVVNGQERIIQGVVDTIGLPGGDFKASIRVRGSRVECLLNDLSLVDSDFLDSSLDAGGIGIKTWDPEPDNSSILVKKVSVAAI